MPGPVSAAHADIEQDCRKCHEPFRQKSEQRLCRDCHEDVDADIERRQGLHGRMLGADRGECRRCHTEHAGRRADIVRLNRDAFDHDATDFALSGAHGRVDCRSCHGAGKKYRDAPAACRDCHTKDDPHRGTLGADCGACHEATAWASAKFDHDKTDFRLVAAHAVAPCGSCHPDQRYEKTPTECYGCHRMDDVHRGRRGTGCGDCHDSARWDRETFDHDTDTEFPLRARHAELSCESCHTGAHMDDPLPTSCAGCHETDDVHRGQMGMQCESCHAESGWREKVRFDHDMARFPLVGLHGTVPCEQCHLTPAYEDAPVACVDCHGEDDVHAKTLGTACGRCHSPGGWPVWRFDHDRETKFVLDGAHQGLACKGCHTQPWTTEPDMPTACVSCHRGDDIHRGAYGPDCARCHSTATFAARGVDR